MIEKPLTDQFSWCFSIYEFECVFSIPASYHGSQFRCLSAWTTSGALPVTHTNFLVNTLDLETLTAKTSRHLFALAIIYVTSVCPRGSIIPVVPLRRLTIHMADF